jgi:hypothetical protein
LLYIVQIVAESFRVPRPLVLMHAIYRDYRSHRSPTFPLRSISGPEGDCDVEWIAGHGDGPFGERASSHALDHHGGRQGGKGKPASGVQLRQSAFCLIGSPPLAAVPKKLPVERTGRAPRARVCGRRNEAPSALVRGHWIRQRANTLPSDVHSQPIARRYSRPALRVNLKPYRFGR